LCRLGAGHRLQFVQQKYAEHLEDEGELDKAEVCLNKIKKINSFFFKGAIFARREST